jgi:hypothetical protein
MSRHAIEVVLPPLNKLAQLLHMPQAEFTERVNARLGLGHITSAQNPAAAEHVCLAGAAEGTCKLPQAQQTVHDASEL